MTQRIGRSGLARVAALAAGLAAAAQPVAAQPSNGQAVAAQPTRFSRVAVDVGRLRALGLGAYAEALGADLEASLRQAFADRMTPGGPALVVRLIGVSMNMYAGSSGRNGGASGNAMNTDYLEGEALVVGRRGEVLLRHPQLATQNASVGGPWNDPSSERRRTTILADTYAQWLRRNLD